MNGCCVFLGVALTCYLGQHELSKLKLLRHLETTSHALKALLDPLPRQSLNLDFPGEIRQEARWSQKPAENEPCRAKGYQNPGALSHHHTVVSLSLFLLCGQGKGTFQRGNHPLPCWPSPAPALWPRALPPPTWTPALDVGTDSPFCCL